MDSVGVVSLCSDHSAVKAALSDDSFQDRLGHPVTTRLPGYAS